MLTIPKAFAYKVFLAHETTIRSVRMYYTLLVTRSHRRFIKEQENLLLSTFGRMHVYET